MLTEKMIENAVLKGYLKITGIIMVLFGIIVGIGNAVEWIKIRHLHEKKIMIWIKQKNNGLEGSS